MKIIEFKNFQEFWRCTCGSASLTSVLKKDTIEAELI